MPPEQIKFNLDVGKIISVLVAGFGVCMTISYYAGTLTQKVEDIEARTTKLETMLMLTPADKNIAHVNYIKPKP